MSQKKFKSKKCKKKIQKDPKCPPKKIHRNPNKAIKKVKNFKNCKKLQKFKKKITFFQKIQIFLKIFFPEKNIFFLLNIRNTQFN